MLYSLICLGGCVNVTIMRANTFSLLLLPKMKMGRQGTCGMSPYIRHVQTSPFQPQPPLYMHFAVCAYILRTAQGMERAPYSMSMWLPLCSPFYPYISCLAMAKRRFHLRLVMHSVRTRGRVVFVIYCCVLASHRIDGLGNDFVANVRV